jgi:hypothetical protein
MIFSIDHNENTQRFCDCFLTLWIDHKFNNIRLVLLSLISFKPAKNLFQDWFSIGSLFQCLDLKLRKSWIWLRWCLLSVKLLTIIYWQVLFILRHQVHVFGVNAAHGYNTIGSWLITKTSGRQIIATKKKNRDVLVFSLNGLVIH